MNENETNITKGQEIAANLCGEAAGLGAVCLVAGLLGKAVNAIPGGKAVKVLCAMGAIGISWTVDAIVTRESTKTIKDAIEGINDLKKLFKKEKVVVVNEIPKDAVKAEEA